MQEIVPFTFPLMAACAVSHFDSDKEQVQVTKLPDKQCKMKANWV